MPAGSTDRHILLAVDESENARRAVLYVADFLGGLPGFRVTILHIIPELSEDYFETEAERIQWHTDKKSATEKMLSDYRQILIQSGFPEDKVMTRMDVRQCSSIAGCILDRVKKIDASTVVVGRRGISKKEEMIFGSISSAIMHEAKDCSVWVIE
jgi:nucleotide-binding universal stress UspA family protein